MTDKQKKTVIALYVLNIIAIIAFFAIAYRVRLNTEKIASGESYRELSESLPVTQDTIRVNVERDDTVKVQLVPRNPDGSVKEEDGMVVNPGK